MASGAPGSESHTLLAQSRGEHGPSPSCAPPRPEECPRAWHEDPGVPREGLKPGAVVEEGGKRNWGDPSRENEVGLGVRAGPHQDPPGSACTCSELAKRAWLHSLAASGRGAEQPGAEGPFHRPAPGPRPPPRSPQLDLSRSLPCSPL